MKKILLAITLISSNAVFANNTFQDLEKKTNLVKGELTLKVYNCSPEILDNSNFNSRFGDNRSLYFLAKINLVESNSADIRVATKDTKLKENGDIEVGGIKIGKVTVEELRNKTKEGCMLSQKEKSNVTIITTPFALKNADKLSYQVLKTHTFCRSRNVPGSLSGTLTNFDLHEIYATDSSGDQKTLSVAETNFTYNVHCSSDETYRAGKAAMTNAMVNGVIHSPALLLATGIAIYKNSTGGSMSVTEAASEARRIEEFVQSPNDQIEAIVRLRRTLQNVPLAIVEAGSHK